MEFKGFKKIFPIGQLYCSITQKIHGSNAQIFIFKKEDGSLDLKCGKRSGWISIESDNFGFASYIESQKDKFLLLGEGHHYGEWCGPGINSGEGLKNKTFVLFNYKRYENLE